MIKISYPNSYVKERLYIYDVIFNHWLGIKYSAEPHEFTHTILQIPEIERNKEIILEDKLFRISQNKWLSKESLPKIPLSYFDLSLMPFRDYIFNLNLPVLYGEGNIIIDENKINIKLDILGSIFFMITRYEEIANQIYDNHERFSYKFSLAYEEKFLTRPLTNEYLDVLWYCLKILWPSIKRKERSYKLFLTHDVDHPYSIEKKSLSGIVKTSMADIINRKDIFLFYKRIKFLSIDKKNKNYSYDPNNTFNFIMNTSEKNNITSSFYFISGNTAGPIDGHYDLDMPIVRQLMRNIYERGHEIGIHPSYNTFISKENLKKEFDNLLRVAKIESIKQDQWGGRQHYLRWRAPTTWQNWEDVGLNYDSTLSFADHIGFRCGICYDFPVFNLLTSKQLKLKEFPLIVMEGSLLGKNYQNKGLKETTKSILDLVETVKFFRGTFTLLWHNNMLISSSERKIYEKIVKNIS